MRKVRVLYRWEGVAADDFTDQGVFYEDRGMVLRCDKWGEVAINYATPVEGTDDVIVEQGAEELLSDNADLFIELVMSGGAAK